MAKVEVVLLADGRLAIKAGCPQGEMQLVWLLWKALQVIGQPQQPGQAAPLSPILLARGALPSVNGG